MMMAVVMRQRWCGNGGGDNGNHCGGNDCLWYFREWCRGKLMMVVMTVGMIVK